LPAEEKVEVLNASAHEFGKQTPPWDVRLCLKQSKHEKDKLIDKVLGREKGG